MAQAISKFFKDLGLPFRNDRWSWGAQQGNVLLLRTWAHEHSFKEKRVTVLHTGVRYEGYQHSVSPGLDERIVQLERVWNGGGAAYTVMANAVDTTVFGLTIKDYRDDAVFAIKELVPGEDGEILAVLGELVAVGDFAEHSRAHLTAPGVGPFPADDNLRTGVSTSGYQEKIPLIRAWLEETCRQRGVVTYGDVMTRFDMSFWLLRNAMSRIGHECRDAGFPILTAVIVNKDTLRCSEGLRAEFGVEDDHAERERCYAHWAAAVQDEGQKHESDLKERAKRFAQAEVRPDQAKFRDAVFLACQGRCVVSGCDVPEALDAAHLSGRNWREGQNQATDGVLLRRDLHALYDRGLLVLTEGGGFQLDQKILRHYGSLREVVK